MTETPLFSFGQYQLGSAIDGLIGLVEFSPLEYRAIQSNLPDEQIYKAPPVDFLCVPWKVHLGCIRNQIYKIAPHWESSDSVEAADVLSRVYEYCLKHWGAHTESNPNMKLWKTWWGNVVVQTYQLGQTSGISLFFTNASLLRLHVPSTPYRFGKWFGYFQMAAGGFSVLASLFTILIFPLPVFGALGIFSAETWRVILSVAAAVMGYGLAEKKRWGLHAMTALYGAAVLIAVGSLMMTFQTSKKWDEMYTDASRQAFQQLRQEWLVIHDDPKYAGLEPEIRQQLTDYYFSHQVKGNAAIAEVLSAHPDSEMTFRELLLAEQGTRSQQFSSADLNGCVVDLGLEHLDTCITQCENYYMFQLLFTVAFTCPVLAYYWKRRRDFP